MDSNKLIAYNSIVIFIRLCVVSVVSLACSRFVLDALGASDYGLYNVVGGIVTLLNVVNSSMMSTTYRFIAFELGKKENSLLNKVFNTCFSIHACFSILIIIFGIIIGDWYIENHLNVEVGKVADALFIFHISLATAAVNTLLVPFQGTLVAYERFSAIAIIDILVNLFKFLAIVALIYSEGNRLRIYSVIMLLCILLNSGGYFLYCWKKYRDVVKVTFSADMAVLKDMLSFALWTLFGACANISKVQGCAIIINLFFGTLVNAAFAIANQVESFILLFARSLNNAAIPQITKSFSVGDKQRSIVLTSYISKYTFILMCLVAFPVMLEMDFLLGLWLKDVPQGTSTFCRLIVLGGLLDCLGAGIPALVNATGKIRNYQIILHCFTLLGLPISYVLYKIGYGQYTISVVYCIIIGTSAILRLYLLKRLYRIDISIILRKSYTKIFYMFLPLFAFYMFYDTSSTTFFGHVFGGILAEIFLVAIIIFIGMETNERKMVRLWLTKRQ